MGVREPTIARDRERGLTGVVETLTAGYTTVNRNLWILAVPVLLDLFYWLGPHLSLKPLLQQVFGDGQIPVGIPAEMLQTYQDTRAGLLQAGEGFNLFSLLVTHYPGIPSLMAGREGIGTTITLADPGAALGLLVLLPIVGIGLAAVYYVSVGRPVRGTPEGTGQLGGRAWRTWWRLLAFVAMLLGVSLLAGVPMGVVAFAAGAAGDSLFGFLGAFVWVAAMWIQFYLFFLVDALVIGDFGPLRAMRNSIAVVRFNMGSALGFIALVWIITLGMPVVWGALAENPAGILVGIVGSAYISTGLAIASMTYYRDRAAALNR